MSAIHHNKRTLGLLLAAALAAWPLAAGAYTSGGWLRNEMTGCSVWSTEPAPGKTFNWSGDCRTGIVQGRGVLLWFTNGIRSGRYTGEYVDGRMSGRGVFEYPNGDLYDGEFRDDTPNGHGTIRAVNGNRSAGLFRDGHLVRGEARTDNGKSYKAISNNALPLQAERTFPDGSAGGGLSRNDPPKSWGVFTTPARGRYEGEFENGRPNGFGTYTAPDGEAYAGLWTNGCFQQRDRTATVLEDEKDCGFKLSP